MKKITIGLPLSFCIIGVCIIIAIGVDAADFSAFNAKYKDKGISVQKVAMQGWVLKFTLPASAAPVVAQATPTAVVAPMEMARDDGEDEVAKLEKLKTMLERGLVTQEEHDAKKAEILAHM